MTVKIAGKLPKSDDQNGLDSVEREFLRDPSRPQLAIVVLTTAKITTDVENYDRYPTVMVRAVEPIHGADTGRLRAMLQRAHEERTGNLELPAEWEQVLADLVTPPLPGTEPER